MDAPMSEPTPAPMTTAPADRPTVSARARRRSGRRAGVRGRLPRSAAARARRWSGISTRRRSPAATSSTTSATRTTSRCATCSRRSSRMPPASIRSTLDEIERYTKLFWINTGPYNNLTARKFVLDLHARGVRRRGARRRSAPARRFPLQDGETLDALLARLQPMFFDLDVDPTVTSKTPRAGQGHPHRQREQPLRRRDDEGSRGVRGAVSAQLAAREARRPAGRRGLPRRRPLQRADRGDRRSTSRRRSRSRPSRWRGRCAR